ncbi:hypothetical protein E2I00_019432, partial [Balaenoptera physalus]
GHQAWTPGFVPADHSGQERETKKARDQLASGAQSNPHDSPTRGDGTHSEDEGFAVDDEDSDGEPNTWELSEEVSGCPPEEQAADLFNEDWDLELKAEVRPWVCCAPQGDMTYNPAPSTSTRVPLFQDLL